MEHKKQEMKTEKVEAKTEMKAETTVEHNAKNEMTREAAAAQAKAAIEAEQLAKTGKNQKKFSVTVRHSPLPVKSLTVVGANEDEAFMEFCRVNKVKAEELARQQSKRRPTFESPLPGDVGFFAQNKHLFELTIKEVS